METLEFSSEFFNAKHTLECGQIFRFKEYLDGFIVYSLNKCCYVYTKEDKTYLTSSSIDYFVNFFDLDRDYKNIYEESISYGIDILTTATNIGKGIRILNQDALEVIFSFIISQNNNIKRIKQIINRLCESLGEKVESEFGEFYSFPTYQKILENKDVLENLGLGYRLNYLISFAKEISSGFDAYSLKYLSSKQIYDKLINFYGIGPKVANCVILFGYHSTKSFPVDTWIKKIYKEYFNGTLTDTKKITEFFIEKFKDNAGYIQQYLFFYKRNILNNK